MIHNLDLFSSAKGHLCSKYAALVGWLETVARDAVKASVTFAYIRNMMIEGALEYATNPSGKLLFKYGDGACIRKFERMIRSSSNVGIGQSTNLSFKRALPDLNKDSRNTPHKRAYNPGRGRGFSSRTPRNLVFIITKSKAGLRVQAAVPILPQYLLQLAAGIFRGTEYSDTITLVCTDPTHILAVSRRIVQDDLGRNILCKESNLKRIGFVHSMYPNRAMEWICIRHVCEEALRR